MAENPRYIDNQDGTITDQQTGLTWAREDSWQTENRWLSWDEAWQYAQDLNNRKFAGHMDWRLPEKEELLSLCDSTPANTDKYGKPTRLNPVFPPGGLATHWSGDYIGNDGYLVDYATGEHRMLYKSKSGRMATRPVRGKPLSQR